MPDGAEAARRSSLLEVRGQRAQPRLPQRARRPPPAAATPSAPAATDPCPGRSPRRRRPRRRPARAATGSRRWRTRRPRARRRAEPARQPLRQPALHPARRDGDHLGGERVGRRFREQRGERVDEAVGPLGAVDVQHGAGAPRVERVTIWRPCPSAVSDDRGHALHRGGGHPAPALGERRDGLRRAGRRVGRRRDRARRAARAPRGARAGARRRRLAGRPPLRAPGQGGDRRAARRPSGDDGARSRTSARAARRRRRAPRGCSRPTARACSTRSTAIRTPPSAPPGSTRAARARGGRGVARPALDAGAAPPARPARPRLARAAHRRALRRAGARQSCASARTSSRACSASDSRRPTGSPAPATRRSTRPRARAPASCTCWPRPRRTARPACPVGRARPPGGRAARRAGAGRRPPGRDGATTASWSSRSTARRRCGPTGRRRRRSRPSWPARVLELARSRPRLQAPEPLTGERLVPAPEQWGAVRAAFASRLSIVTGGPGTGKTATIRLICAAAAAQKASVALVAPTGRAARRMAESTGIDASTIHSALGWVPGQGPTVDELATDLLIVDETSMANLELLVTLLRAVGPADARRARRRRRPARARRRRQAVRRARRGAARRPVARLTHIFRQAAGSMIVRGAHAVRHGRPPSFAAAEGLTRDLFLIERDDPRAALDEVVSLVAERLPAHYGIDPLADIQVFAPVYKGALGIDALNARLREALNPDGRPVARRPPAARRQAHALRPQPPRPRPHERHDPAAARAPRGRRGPARLGGRRGDRAARGGGAAAPARLRVLRPQGAGHRAAGGACWSPTRPPAPTSCGASSSTPR